MKTHLEDEIFSVMERALAVVDWFASNGGGWNPNEIPPEHQAYFIPILLRVAGEYADKSFAVIPARTTVAAADGKFLIKYPQVTRLSRRLRQTGSKVSPNFPILRYYTGSECASEATPGGGTIELVENCGLGTYWN